MTSSQDRAFFISGTGTDVGKTSVCRALAASLSKRSMVTYMKPVQTGCLPLPDGRLCSPDFDKVRAVAGVSIPCDENIHVPYRFSNPCSPHLAAQLAGVEISLERIAQCYWQIRSLHHGVILVEGAGGVLAPLSQDTYMIDLAQVLGIPLVLVASTLLGTLNHTFLSVNSVGAKGLVLAAVICSDLTAPSDPFEGLMRDDNVAMIRRFVAPIPVYRLSHQKNPAPELENFFRDIGI